MTREAKNLSWMTFNHRLVIWEPTYKKTQSWKKTRYERCRCLLCWKEKYVNRSHLIWWRSKCCWCEREDKRQYNIWEKYWFRTVIWERKWDFIKCKCVCWLIKDVNIWHMIRWATKSCWCVNKISLITKQTNLTKKNLYQILYSEKHLLSKTTFYHKYSHAKSRCENENCERYKSYWWRWIKFEWSCFEDFYHDMYSSYRQHIKEFWENDTTLDRIDVNWNYCKENCRWATRYEQRNNTQKSKKIEYDWVTYSSISDLCHKLWRDKDKVMIDTRIRRGMSVKDALLIPKKTNVKKI